MNSQVELSVKPKEVAPAHNFLLNVSSTINSSVSLSAIDQRVLLIDSRHDITIESIFKDELSRYDAIPTEATYDPNIPIWFFSRSYQKKFIDVGAVILTNTKQEIPCEPSEPSPSVTEATTTKRSCPEENPYLAPILFNASEYYVESFLFKTVDVTVPADDKGVRGGIILNETAPGSQAAWIISGISVSEEYGIGLTSPPTSLCTFLAFYIELLIPAAIKIGEIAQLEILIVNLLEESLVVDVTFFNKDKKFRVIRPHAYNWTSIPDGYLQNVVVQNRSIYRMRIEIQPKVIGLELLKVSATSSKAGDIVEKQLVVFPNGFSHNENNAEFVLVESCQKDGKVVNLTCEIPSDVKNETVEIQATVSGDVLALTLLHNDFLVRLPTGSGEQTMINFVPNMLALEYLTAAKQLTTSFNKTVRQHLEIGYQKMLKFRHTDGSFSAFGSADKNGSTWLTAHVGKFLQRAQQFIVDVEDPVIQEALQFIASKQQPNGSFTEDGAVIHENLQSGTGNGVGFTSYIAIVLQESSEFFPQFKSNVESALKYVKANLDSSDIYSLVLVTYLSVMSNDPDQDDLIEKLVSKATKTPKYVYWKKNPQVKTVTNLDIEISSYGLLILDSKPELYKDAFKIFRWLLSNQNSNGGFQSTQDTAVALEALTKYSHKFSTQNTNVFIAIVPDQGPAIDTSINQNTTLIPQSYSLQKNVREIDVNAVGTGYSIIQLSCSYYHEKVAPNPKFNLTVSFDNTSCDNKIILNVRANTVTDLSDMVVFEVEFPSGFLYDHDTILSSAVKVSFTNFNFFFFNKF